MVHKEFKMLYNSIKKHIDAIASQLLTSWVRNALPPTFLLLLHDVSDAAVSDLTTYTHCQSTSIMIDADFAAAIAPVNQISEFMSHRYVIVHVLHMERDGVLV